MLRAGLAAGVGDSDLLPQEAVVRTEIAKSTPNAFEYFE